MTRQPTARLWAHVPGVTYPNTSMTEAQMDAERDRIYRARSKVKKPGAGPITARRSLEIAKEGRRLIDSGKSVVMAASIIGVCPKVMTYHIAKNGLRTTPPGKNVSGRAFVLTAAMRARCDKLRPHTSWDDICAKLGVNRSTLIKHYARKEKA